MTPRLPKGYIPMPFRRRGPGACSCTVCGWAGSTNALARASHLQGKQHTEAEERIEAMQKKLRKLTTPC